MNYFKNLIAGSAAAMVVVLTSVLGFSAVASADCVQYDANGTATSTTPVFNHFCGVPNGVGNESDFVRLRPSTGDATSPANNAAYTSTLADQACNDGDGFDVRTYIHNGADPSYNKDGSGSAVAHNVQVAMNAPLGSTSNNFTFTSTVTASNASSVTDTGTLTCAGGKQVKLSIVPGSVHVYSKPYGWNALSDGAVNGTTKVGSPTVGSGDQYGCWDNRITVVYEVKVTVIPPTPQVTATCDLFTLVASDERRVKVSQFSYTNKNASIKNVVINWGDNSTVTLTDAAKVVGSDHQYKTDGTYNVTATITFAVASKPDVVSGGAGSACAKPVSYTSNGTPTTPPTTTTTTTVAPTRLVNTGAGSVAGIFAATSALGAAGYRYFLGRRLSRQ